LHDLCAVAGIGEACWLARKNLETCAITSGLRMPIIGSVD